MNLLTLWKLILSSNGRTQAARVDLSHVMIFRQTGNRTSAMLNFKISAAPFAVVKQ